MMIIPRWSLVVGIAAVYYDLSPCAGICNNPRAKANSTIFPSHDFVKPFFHYYKLYQKASVRSPDPCLIPMADKCSTDI